MQPTAIDLFAGAGGATEGLKRAGIRVLAAVENDPLCCESFRANHREVELIRKDIRKVNPADLAAELSIARGELTVLKACPPCQGWSTFGATNQDDPRNALILQVQRFVKVLMPKALILENVPGIQKDPRFERLCRALRSLGYAVQEYIVDAVDFGVPQRRRRLILLAIRNFDQAALPRELGGRLAGRKWSRRPTCGQAIHSMKIRRADKLHRWRLLRPDTMERVQAIPLGGNRFDLPRHLQLTCHRRLDGRHATASYGRMNPGKPAPTMTTRCTTPACGTFIHPFEDRGLSLREAALLQTFPSRYQFEGTYGDIERQIGNAVPVQMAEGIAKIVLRLMESNDGK